ncbi:MULTISPECIES: UDP-N-acetylmuramoyl-L-alanyl-D-glutamate--2,6-diaminopimelate ligase [unclassified Limnobacter]|jgi:UDP-N-acetylmuramyl-tripeptide synthetase|uniref:UDP-N-acetylmuramoyl-L-alanyl-D-glutamate--2, 6-diaminopimelate ligase n=1 Tax=unclassified Limnobacter TaxID=2630203 RepID=UPI000C416143|nr:MULTISPECIES: UDP-N-acetylmuramoyl-L-alanyl-D-glutamate--2,6-diaminopimelate ligase [unclassified Limnobacter]MAG82085.1 UDP-N-acetylmuramoyl-L-alanyl-D-glutamate--2,6-diaminopimelate ligase [Sutterellaceae bacterium]MBA4314784.1 UDP-N-acetylmuramoyl-L-alanyl-D-glutamate--2,6-diaminopimelate ligase [Alcaligenaceae bacterium]|tara:strand:+ start:1827 stop:3323 length:1497 start_codon:yes stop_codon:yes gene_type:complete
MISAYLHSVSEVLAELHERGFYADCSGLVTDHRRLTGPRDVFLAVPGEKFDPRNLADDLLIEQRCGLVLVDYDDQRAYQSASVLPVLHLKTMLADLAFGYYETPSDAMTIIAVTGTNGKTTVTRWLAQALNHLGKKAAVIGTLGYGEPDQLKAHTGLTTPDVVGVHHLLHELRQHQFDTVCIEASSIGLEQRRLACVSIDVALFTNLSQDHLDYHGDMAAYGRSKMILASWPTLRLAVVNADDSFGMEFLANVQRRNIDCSAVGRADSAECQILSVAHQENGQRIELKINGASTQIDTSIIGEFNADNMALVFATLIRLGYDASQVKSALAEVTPAPGRMQHIEGEPAVVVDYAHTPDALEKTLLALRPFANKRQGKLWVVFGCGGDRDRSKRPLMGAAAADKADFVVVTSDNPRSEKPENILQEIVDGIDKARQDKLHVEVDRVRAIEFAVAKASAKDVVLLAGKGHESTQTIGAQVIAHSDVQCATSALGKRGAHA